MCHLFSLAGRIGERPRGGWDLGACVAGAGPGEIPDTPKLDFAGGAFLKKENRKTNQNARMPKKLELTAVNSVHSKTLVNATATRRTCNRLPASFA